MLPDFTLPSSLVVLLATFRPCFTAPTFEVFRALVSGTLAQTGRRTVCGMLVGAGLSRVWPHDRAHRFFSAARWCPDQVGLVLARLVVGLLVGEGEPVSVALDDTLFHRSGKKVWAAGWFHNGSAKGTHQVGHGNNWVVVGVVVLNGWFCCAPSVRTCTRLPSTVKPAAATPYSAAPPDAAVKMTS